MIKFFHKNKKAEQEEIVDDYVEQIEHNDTEEVALPEVEESAETTEFVDAEVVNEEENLAEDSNNETVDFEFIDDEIDNVTDTEDIVENDSDEQTEDVIEQEEPKDHSPIKVRSITNPSDNNLNSFDLFFIKLWAILVSFINILSDGINYIIYLIFKKKAPRKYVNAFVSILLIVVIQLIIILPIALAK